MIYQSSSTSKRPMAVSLGICDGNIGESVKLTREIEIGSTVVVQTKGARLRKNNFLALLLISTVNFNTTIQSLIQQRLTVQNGDGTTPT